MSKRRPDAPPDDDLDELDRSLFRRATAGTKPLSRDKVEPERRHVAPRARFARDDEQSVLEQSLKPTAAELDWHSGDSLAFAKTTVGARTLRKLRRGRFSIQAELDLHGLTVPEARDALKAFLAEADERGLTCVRVIHGKGLGSGARGPVLKRQVNAWLQRWNNVLAFASARPEHGGTGAVYVLLQPSD